MGRYILTIATGLLVGASGANFTNADDSSSSDVAKALGFTMQTLAQKDMPLSKYQGKVLLIVNVASKCGLTPQYEQLQAMHEKYGEKGLAILAFPCNQFGAQEPGSASEIRAFCTDRYGVTFDMFSKINVNGDDACDLYKYLTSLELKPKSKGPISWNFEKFLIDRKGRVIARFAPAVKPNDPSLVAMVQSELERE
jgi:glutathione peroxidase